MEVGTKRGITSGQEKEYKNNAFSTDEGGNDYKMKEDVEAGFAFWKATNGIELKVTCIGDD